MKLIEGIPWIWNIQLDHWRRKTDGVRTRAARSERGHNVCLDAPYFHTSSSIPAKLLYYEFCSRALDYCFSSIREMCEEVKIDYVESPSSMIIITVGLFN